MYGSIMSDTMPLPTTTTTPPRAKRLRFFMFIYPAIFFSVELSISSIYLKTTTCDNTAGNPAVWLFFISLVCLLTLGWIKGRPSLALTVNSFVGLFLILYSVYGVIILFAFDLSSGCGPAPFFNMFVTSVIVRLIAILGLILYDVYCALYSIDDGL